MISSEDGYCSFVTFDDLELGTPYLGTLTAPSAPPSIVLATPVASRGPKPKSKAFFGTSGSNVLDMTGKTKATTDLDDDGVEAEKKRPSASNEAEGVVKKKAKRATLVSVGVSSA